MQDERILRTFFLVNFILDILIKCILIKKVYPYKKKSVHCTLCSEGQPKKSGTDVYFHFIGLDTTIVCITLQSGHFGIAWHHACEKSGTSYLRTSAYAKYQRNITNHFEYSFLVGLQSSAIYFAGIPFCGCQINKNILVT